MEDGISPLCRPSDPWELMTLGGVRSVTSLHRSDSRSVTSLHRSDRRPSFAVNQPPFYFIHSWQLAVDKAVKKVMDHHYLELLSFGLETCKMRGGVVVLVVSGPPGNLVTVKWSWYVECEMNISSGWAWVDLIRFNSNFDEMNFDIFFIKQPDDEFPSGYYAEVKRKTSRTDSTWASVMSQLIIGESPSHPTHIPTVPYQSRIPCVYPLP